MFNTHAKLILHYYQGKQGYSKPRYIVKRTKYVLHIKFRDRIVQLDMRNYSNEEEIVERLEEEENISKLMGSI